MRKLNTEATTAQPQRFDVSTWSDQARRLARNEAEAAALRLLLGLVVLGLVAGAAVVVLDVRLRLDAAAVGMAVGALLLLVALRWLQCYSAALGRNTHEVRRATWQEELRTGQDIDGDGVVGDPFRTVKVRKRDRVEEITLDLPRNSERNQPIMDGWGVSKADLVAILYEAELVRGLQERNWVGDGVDKFVLPSGREVTQIIFRQVLAALADHEMASKRANRWQLDVAADEVAKTLKTVP